MKVIERLGKDVGAEFPGVEGFSLRSLKYVSAFAEEWPEKEFVQQVIAQLPWDIRPASSIASRISQPENGT